MPTDLFKKGPLKNVSEKVPCRQKLYDEKLICEDLERSLTKMFQNSYYMHYQKMTQ